MMLTIAKIIQGQQQIDEWMNEYGELVDDADRRKNKSTENRTTGILHNVFYCFASMII